MTRKGSVRSSLRFQIACSHAVDDKQDSLREQEKDHDRLHRQQGRARHEQQDRTDDHVDHAADDEIPGASEAEELNPVPDDEVFNARDNQLERKEEGQRVQHRFRPRENQHDAEKDVENTINESQTGPEIGRHLRVTDDLHDPEENQRDSHDARDDDRRTDRPDDADHRENQHQNAGADRRRPVLLHIFIPEITDLLPVIRSVIIEKHNLSSNSF